MSAPTVAVGPAASSTGTTITGVYDHTPIAGETLIMLVVGYKGSNVTISGTAPPGWTAGPTGHVGSYISLVYRYMGMMMYWKLATGGETAPVAGIANAANSEALVFQVSGLDTVAPHVRDSTMTAAAINKGSQALAVPAITVAAGDWVFNGIGVIGTAPVSVAWSDGSTEIATAAGTNCSLEAGGKLITSGTSYTGSATLSATSSMWSAAFASMVFLTGTTPPPPGGTVHNRRVAGAAAVAVRKIKSGGTATIATHKIRVSGSPY